MLILTTFSRPGYLRRAMEQGASGFLLKDAPASELAAAIRRVVAGERIVDPGPGGRRAGRGRQPADRRASTRCSTRRAGTAPSPSWPAALHLSPGTTRNHLSAIMGKLGAHSRIEAIRVAEEKGWL